MKDDRGTCSVVLIRIICCRMTKIYISTKKMAAGSHLFAWINSPEADTYRNNDLK